MRASWVLWFQLSEAILPIYHTHNVPSCDGKILEEPDVTHASQALHSNYNMTKVFFRWQCQSHFLYPSFTDINFDSWHTYTTVLGNDDHQISQNEASNVSWWAKCVISHAAFSKSLDDNNNNIHGVPAEPHTDIIEGNGEDSQSNNITCTCAYETLSRTYYWRFQLQVVTQEVWKGDRKSVV